MAELPRGTVTLVFTDIEGSTRLLEALGNGYGEVLAEHRILLRESFTAHGGVEVDTQGDAFFYAFPRAQDATRAAVESQRLLASHPWPANAEVRVRMGIHTGEPQTSSEGYVGPDVHRAARICAAAHGGQVLLSQATQVLIEVPRLDRATLHDLGEHALKDISARMHLYELVIEGLPSDFPPIRTLDAHPTNLPPLPTALIGREQEVARIVAALQSDGRRLITLTGPGGTGKTRLALKVADELLEDFSDGVFVVDLSAVTDAPLVVAQIAAALSLKESGGRGLQETLHDYLASKELLLVIDNFEQVMDAASEVASLLTSAPDVRVLVTSREPLRLAGEQEFAVPPLSLPSSSSPRLEEARRAPAVALFTERARGVRADFALTEDNVAAVIAICRRLDGLPLAIELAAARVKVLSPQGLLDRLDHSLRLLSSGRRDASERQRTLRGAVTWSYELLSENEQKLFCRLGVFSGGWSLEAAEAVCERSDLELEVLDGLASLVDKSLVRAVAGDEERFSMLETIREFAIERLDESEEAEEFRRAHAEYFRGLAEEAEPHLVGEDQKEWLDRLERDHDNVRGALNWSVAEAPDLALAIAAPLWRFWYVRGHLTQARRWLQATTAQTNEETSPVRAKALRGLAVCVGVQGEYGRSEHVGQQSLAIYEQLGDQSGVSSVLETLAIAAENQGNVDLARTRYERALELGEKIGDVRGATWVGNNLADLLLRQGDYDAAKQRLKTNIRLLGELGDKEGLAFALVTMSEVLLAQTSYAESLKAAQESLLLSEELGHSTVIAYCFEVFAAIHSRQGKADLAARSLGVAENLLDATGVQLAPSEKKTHEDTVRQTLRELSPDEFVAGLQEGRAVPVERAIAEALTWNLQDDSPLATQP